MTFYTDGSVMIKKSHYGYGVWCEELGVKISKIVSPTTHNVCELLAIIHALKIILSHCNKNKNKIYKIYSDSVYAIKSLTVWCKKWKANGWKNSKKQPVKNIKIIKYGVGVLKKIKLTSDVQVHIHHIAAHTNLTTPHHLGNAVADKLAKCGN